MRNNFVQKSKNNENELFGVITDGQLKLDVLLSKSEIDNINIERGTKLEIIGDIQESGK